MKRLIIIIAALVFSFALNAQEELTLSQAIQRGLQNNFQVRIAKLNIEIAGNNTGLGSAGALPTLDFSINNRNQYDKSGTPAYTNGVPGISESESVLNTMAPSLTLNWVLFSGFRISTTKDNLDQLYKLTEGNAAIVVENTIQSIILAYYQALLETEKLSIVTELKNLSKDRYQYLLTKKELGSAVTYDVLQSKNAFLTDSSNVLLQAMNLNSAFMNLNQLLGEAAGKQYILTDELPLYLQEYKLSDLLAGLTKNNKTLQNQYINQNILKNSTKIAKSVMFPTVSLRSGVDVGRTWLKADEYDRVDYDNFDYYAAFALNWNLYNGGNTRSAIQNAKIEEEIASLQVEEITNSLSIVLSTMYDFYNARKQLYNVAEENMKSTELNLQLSMDRFKAGTINSFNYRDVQIMYMNASFNKLESIYNLIDTHTELLRLTGGIIEEYQQ